MPRLWPTSLLATNYSPNSPAHRRSDAAIRRPAPSGAGTCLRPALIDQGGAAPVCCQRQPSRPPGDRDRREQPRSRDRTTRDQPGQSGNERRARNGRSATDAAADAQVMRAIHGNQRKILDSSPAAECAQLSELLGLRREVRCPGGPCGVAALCAAGGAGMAVPRKRRTSSTWCSRGGRQEDPGHQRKGSHEPRPQEAKRPGRWRPEARPREGDQGEAEKAKTAIEGAVKVPSN
jgi:hypothetical protein